MKYIITLAETYLFSPVMLDATPSPGEVFQNFEKVIDSSFSFIPRQHFDVLTVSTICDIVMASAFCNEGKANFPFFLPNYSLLAVSKVKVQKWNSPFSFVSFSDWKKSEFQDGGGRKRKEILGERLSYFAKCFDLSFKKKNLKGVYEHE